MSTKVDSDILYSASAVETVRETSTEVDMKYCPALSSLELLAKCLLG